MSLTAEAKCPFNADYVVKADYGDSVTWKKKPTTTDNGATAEVWGHKKTIPCFGQTLLSETKKGWALFQFQDVTRMGNPSDMFSATVTQIDYRAKEQPKP